MVGEQFVALLAETMKCKRRLFAYATCHRDVLDKRFFLFIKIYPHFFERCETHVLARIG